jgi:hypothetical protein
MDRPDLRKTVYVVAATDVVEGQTININKNIPIGTSHEEIERMARESFLKLQEMVAEYHNREE